MCAIEFEDCNQCQWNSKNTLDLANDNLIYYWTPQLQKLVMQLTWITKILSPISGNPPADKKIGEKNHEKPPADRRLDKIFGQKSWKTPGWPPVLWTKIRRRRRRRLSRRNISSKTPGWPPAKGQPAPAPAPLPSLWYTTAKKQEIID